MQIISTGKTISLTVKDMKVMKFGGTSVGSAQRMKNVVGLVSHEHNPFVVLSAMSGTTNSLITISQSIKDSELSNARKQIEDLLSKYIDTANQLLSDPQTLTTAETKISSIFNSLRSFAMIFNSDITI